MNLNIKEIKVNQASNAYNFFPDEDAVKMLTLGEVAPVLETALNNCPSISEAYKDINIVYEWAEYCIRYFNMPSHNIVDITGHMNSFINMIKSSAINLAIMEYYRNRQILGENIGNLLDSSKQYLEKCIEYHKLLNDGFKDNMTPKF